MKKVLKGAGLLVACPVLLFLILTALLYVPPIQNWAVQKTMAMVSEQTGMDISLGRVSLKWTFDLALDDFRIIQHNQKNTSERDTIADIRQLVADVQVWPLISRQVIVVDELAFHDARFNTNGFIDDLRIKGNAKELWLSSKGIDLNKETVEVNGARLRGGDLDIALSDTAAIDTTPSTIKWIIKADSLSIAHTKLSLHLPGDTLHIKSYIDNAIGREACIDIGESVYQLGCLEWRGGNLNYDDRWKPEIAGFDYNHLAFSDINLRIDSLYYSDEKSALRVCHLSSKEKSGLEVKQLSGAFRMDSTTLVLPDVVLKTPDSDALLSFEMKDGSDNRSLLKLRLNAQLGKQDLIRFTGDLPQQFIQRYPNYPLNIKGSLDGDMKQLSFTGLDISLPTAFHLKANGTASNLDDRRRLKANITFSGETQRLDFVSTLLPRDVASDYRLPSGMRLNGSLKADATRYQTDLTLQEGGGSVKLKGTFNVPLDRKGELNTTAMSYDADLSISQLNLHHFMPKDSLYTLTADIHATGFSTDLLANGSHLTAEGTISQLEYGSLNLHDISAKADVHDGRALLDIDGHNELFDGTIDVDALLESRRFDGTITADLKQADFQRLRITEEPLVIGLCGHVDIRSDLKETHYVNGLIGDLFIRDEKRTFLPEEVGLLLNTNRDTTYLRAQSGDLIIKFDASGGYERLLAQFNELSDTVISQYKQNIIDQPAIKRLLPTMKVHIESFNTNPLSNLLKTSDIDYKAFYLDLATSPESGINGKTHLYSLRYDSTRIDTMRLNMIQKGERMTYSGQVRNNKRNPQFVFNALFDGHLHQHGALAGLRLFDAREQMALRLGATAEMESEGLRLRLMPENPTIGYKVFKLNKDNFIFLGRNNKLQAKVDLTSDDRTGLKLYTENQDSTMLQDLTVSIHQLELDQLTATIPYTPHITGRLNGDFHIVQDQQEQINVVSEMSVDNMTYESSPIGNLSTELVYLMQEDNSHMVESRLMLDDKEFGNLSGTYSLVGNKEGLQTDDDRLDFTFDMIRLPLSLMNGFVPDQLMGLDGYAEGSLKIQGSTSHPQIDGEVLLDSAHVISIPYGIRMRIDNDPIRIVDSQLLIENYGLYAYNDEPLVMMGSVDFRDTEHIKTDLRMRARNLLLINSRQEPKSLTFGKAYVNMYGRLQGDLDNLRLRGRLDVLGSTDLTYMLLDSPLSTDNRLDELVKFTDFSDTTQVVVTRPTPSGLNADLTINISQGAHFICNLNAEQTNYIDLLGGGDLRMNYDNEGIKLTGRYTLTNGEMKYSLPVIPLKTFNIKDGSYVEFTGDPMNPRLNITATERTKATVTDESEASRSVAFDCGVVITKTLNDMGLQFIIEAPEDNDVAGDLTTMTAEQRGKVAVTMLTTGMYLVEGNSSFSMNSALNSFLESEINNITGTALKTLDMNMGVGIESNTDATGSMHTDYSFKFSKRFFNNRLKIEIGGKVSTGESNVMGQKQSFFDNVSMEYRINQEATQNLKLFYQQNVYDWLDGYTSFFGAGYIWRHKTDNFWDILTFWRKKEEPRMPMRRTDQPSQRDIQNSKPENPEISENPRKPEKPANPEVPANPETPALSTKTSNK
ncbi:MAG: translocation/assembly module TamB domain-containing protein [Prevotella sp.]|nr:translocation/assembly module TamB domain-containing protein [Prevotella sp.]